MNKSKSLAIFWGILIAVGLLPAATTITKLIPFNGDPSYYVSGAGTLVSLGSVPVSTNNFIASAGGFGTNVTLRGGTYTGTTNSAVKNTDLTVGGLVFPNAQGYNTNLAKLVGTNIGSAVLLGVGTANPTTELQVEAASSSLPTINLSTTGAGSIQTIGRASAGFAAPAGATDLGIKFTGSFYLGRTTAAALIIDNTGNGITTIARLKVSSVGSTLTNIITATATIDFDNMPSSLGNNTKTITVTGAKANDCVVLGPPTTKEAGLNVIGYVSAADTVTLEAQNITAGALNPASATWRVTVIQY